jgi:hypothetical protein
VKSFIKILKEIKKFEYIRLKLYPDLKCAIENDYDDCFDFNKKDALNALRPGDYVWCGFDDHIEDANSKYFEMENMFLSGKHVFKLYEDLDAHMTVDRKLPKSDDSYFWAKNWD